MSIRERLRKPFAATPLAERVDLSGKKIIAAWLGRAIGEVIDGQRRRRRTNANTLRHLSCGDQRPLLC